MDIEQISLDLIEIDNALQAREFTNQDVVAQYANLMAEGVEFEPVKLMWDTKVYYVVDGNHRVQAARKAALQSIAAHVTIGSWRDAKWASLAANASHGLALTNDDKHKIVMEVLLDTEWSRLSDREIVKHIRSVSQPFVSTRRRALELVLQDDPQLTDAEIIAAAGSYKITANLITEIRELCQRPEPLSRKFPEGTLVSIRNEWNVVRVGMVGAHHPDGVHCAVISYPRTFEREPQAQIKQVAFDDLSMATDNERIAYWRNTQGQYDLRCIQLVSGDWLTFDWVREISAGGYDYPTGKQWGIGNAHRVSSDMLRWLEQKYRVLRVSLLNLDDEMKRIANTAAHAGRGKVIPAPPDLKPELPTLSTTPPAAEPSAPIDTPKAIEIVEDIRQALVLTDRDQRRIETVLRALIRAHEALYALLEDELIEDSLFYAHEEVVDTLSALIDKD